MFSISFHEFCHGLAAYRLGDNTAKRMGRLTMNPLANLDITGLIMLVLFHFGWAKPVPVNMNNFKNPRKGMAITAAAGPISNLLLAVVFMFIYGLLYIPSGRNDIVEYIGEMFVVGCYMNIGLAVLNIIPVPPLDGSKVLFAFMSDEAYYKLMKYERYGMIIMVILVATGILGTPLSKLSSAIFSALLPVAQTGSNITYYLFYR